MISKILDFFKQPQFLIDLEVLEDLQIERDNLQYEVEVLRKTLNLKEKEYEVLLAKYVELKVEKDIAA